MSAELNQSLIFSALIVCNVYVITYQSLLLCVVRTIHRIHERFESLNLGIINNLKCIELLHRFAGRPQLRHEWNRILTQCKNNENTCFHFSNGGQPERIGY